MQGRGPDKSLVPRLVHPCLSNPLGPGLLGRSSGQRQPVTSRHSEDNKMQGAAAVASGSTSLYYRKQSLVTLARSHGVTCVHVKVLATPSHTQCTVVAVPSGGGLFLKGAGTRRNGAPSKMN